MKKQRLKVAFGTYKMPELAQILEHAVKRYVAGMCIGIFSFSSLFIKHIDSMLPWVCSVMITQDVKMW